MDHSTAGRAKQIAAIKAMLETPSVNILGQETIGGVMAFVAAYKETSSLPIDPVALVLAYEKYQDQLADEAAGIGWLERGMVDDLVNLIRRGIEDSAGIIGCEPREAADSMSLWCRGVVNRIARGLSKW